ncbi:MAG: PKD domain-containing protein, partial [Planctomycetota bacterium]
PENAKTLLDIAETCDEAEKSMEIEVDRNELLDYLEANNMLSEQDVERIEALHEDAVIRSVISNVLPETTGYAPIIEKALVHIDSDPMFTLDVGTHMKEYIEGLLINGGNVPEPFRSMGLDILNLPPGGYYDEGFKQYLSENAKASSSTKGRVTPARDPNKKYGPGGRVLPGQRLDYKIEYENEGKGIAFGVYFTDTLDGDVNDSTLQTGSVVDINDGSILAGPGSYNPQTRTITWFVGEVGPGQGGYAEFSVNVDSNAPHGTEIINYATVYFPSVPEKTRTNGIVSTVLLNLPPIADGGPDQSVYVGELVTLDGSGSTDPDGDLLTFNWAFAWLPTGSNATLDDPNSVNPTFTPDIPGTYIPSLVVNDGAVDSEPDTVTISTINVAPVADAGDDQSVYVGELVTLDGSGSSDPDGDPLTYHWSFISTPLGSTAALSDPNSVHPNFIADVPGTYIGSLVVNDDAMDSEPDTVTISTINLAPIADAGDDQSIYVGDLVTLNGSRSADPDGDPLTYNWAFTALPEGSIAVLSDPNSVNPTFTADVVGTYVVSLVVNDGTEDSVPDTVSISTINVAPIADAGVDQAAHVGDLVTLNGGGSWDPDGDPLTYNWAFTALPEGSIAVLSDPNSVNPTFTADVAGTYVVSLVVNDGIVDSEPDTVTISTINVAPVADAGDDQSVYVAEQVTLDGSGSTDADGDPLSFRWAFTTLPPGSTAVLNNPTSADPNFVADVAGIYVVSLVVNDGTVDSEPDRITISAVSQQTQAITMVQGAINIINGFAPEIFKNPNNKKALTNKLNAVIDKLENSEYQDALQKLESDVLRKTDGCALSGSPDKNDWIIDCSTQNIIYPLILDTIELIEQLI